MGDPIRNFYWTMESSTPDVATIEEGPNFSGAAALSSLQAFEGSQSLRMDEQTYSMAQVYNDTNVNHLGHVDHSKVVFRFYIPSGQAWDGMLCQIGGKTFDVGSPNDTNDGLQINLDLIAGNQGVEVRWIGDGTGSTSIDTNVLGLTHDTWHKVELQTSVDGEVDGNKYLKLIVNDQFVAFEDTTLPVFTMLANHSMQIGNDLAVATEFYLDNVELWDNHDATPVFTGTEIFVAMQESVSASSTSKTWNSLVGGSAGTTIADLDDSSGSATGIGIENVGAVGTDGDAYNQVGEMDADWIDEAVILQEYHEVNGATVGHLQLTGLDDSKTYTLDIVQSRSVAGLIGDFTTDNFSTFVTSFFSYTNSRKTTITLPDVSPTSGTIDLKYRESADGTQAYVNALRIRENPSEAPVAGDENILRNITQNITQNILQPITG